MATKFSPEGATPGNSKPGVTAAFADSLGQLLATLNTCDMSFVRCLKASNPLAKGIFQSALVLKQLKYTGMLDTLKIRRFGFPKRMGHQEFIDWGKVLALNDGVALQPERQPGDPDKDKIAAENAKAIVEHLQTRYAEEVFSELPESDRHDELYIGQKSEVIVCGTPAKQNVVPLVMMRDWFFTGADHRVKDLLKVHADIATATTQMAIHNNVYRKLQSTSRTIGGMLRGIMCRSDYLTTKWHELEREARTEAVVGLRGHMARMKYQKLRNQHFEAENRRSIQVMPGEMIALW